MLGEWMLSDRDKEWWIVVWINLGRMNFEYEDIRDLEDYGAYTEERFIQSKDHIEDFIHNM